MLNRTIRSKGRITVPIEIRRRLGLKEGDRVEFVVEGEKTIMRPAQPAKNPFEKYAGMVCENSTNEKFGARWKDKSLRKGTASAVP
jgi:antitoxin PrlF